MNQAYFFPNWRDKVVFSAPGPQPQVLYEDDKIKVVVVGLEPGGRIPVHAGGAGVYHFLEGAGQMTVDDNPYAMQPGATLMIPDGATPRPARADPARIHRGQDTGVGRRHQRNGQPSRTGGNATARHDPV